MEAVCAVISSTQVGEHRKCELDDSVHSGLQGPGRFENANYTLHFVHN